MIGLQTGWLIEAIIKRESTRSLEYKKEIITREFLLYNEYDLYYYSR